MEKILWDDKFKIGVDKVDKAHAKLFRIVHKLLDMSEDVEANPTKYREGLKYLEAYSMIHFSEEEAYMRSVRYKGYAQHKRLHDNFRDKTLVALKKDLEMSSYSADAVQRFAEIMNNWLAEHITREDQAIVGRVIAKKGFDLSSQVPIISRAVNKAAMEIFQLEATLVSSEYKGQNIGEAFYCQNCYDMDGGIRIQVLMGVEESLMLHGAGRLSGMRVVQPNEITESAVRRIFELLFQNVTKVFRIEEESKIDKDNRLTRDEFRTEFMKGYPCNLLFSTRNGYFAFCYRSWRAKGQKNKASEESKENGAD